ncbi:unnamed protein product [Somion occarium]|uniref:Carbohydrate esterase family 16 protein n=1 Tax=Somion occarium TaxID=3059160 RepID=A0ABP1D002_9APHY
MHTLSLRSLPALFSLLLSFGFPDGPIKNLVTFGDSYTDISGIGDNGTAWPVYAASYRNLRLHSFAISGATCDQRLTPRVNFPYVVQDELPAYFEQTQSGLKLDPKETLYTLWIGTNDVGADTMMSGKQTPGNTIVQVTQCPVSWVKTLYDTGARNFLFQNMIPLQLTILYRADGYLTRFWTAPHNQTEWSVYMTELVASGNELARLMLQSLSRELPGAHIGLFDSYSFFMDIHDYPQNYLNGTAPLNVTGCINSCIVNEDGSSTCTIIQGTDRDSFLWQDELHPSEQVNRNLARQIVDAITLPETRWTTWMS